jgi:caa(3)-type oxidase subunit IV
MEENSNQSEFKTVKQVYFSIIALTGLILLIHHFNLGVLGIALIVTVAVFEATVLAYFFMHLMTKKKTIHLVLLLTVIVFLTLLFWPAWDIAYSPRTPSEFTQY